jgi:hypothetical protein
MNFGPVGGLSGAPINYEGLGVMPFSVAQDTQQRAQFFFGMTALGRFFEL